MMAEQVVEVAGMCLTNVGWGTAGRGRFGAHPVVAASASAAAS